MKTKKNSLFTRKTKHSASTQEQLTAEGDELHRRLLRISLWDTLNKDRKQPISFAFKAKASDVINRVLAIEYLQNKTRGSLIRRTKERESY
jgi:hypothetical protein